MASMIKIVFLSILVSISIFTSEDVCVAHASDEKEVVHEGASARALFFGNVTTYTTETKQTQGGSASFSTTSTEKETISVNTRPAETGIPEVGSDLTPPKPKVAETVKHPPKKSPAIKREKKQLALGISYWIEQLSADNSVLKIKSDNDTFKSGDRLRFAFKTNRDGYLYILAIGSSGNGYVLFPDTRINQGSNLVKAFNDYRIPDLAKSFVMDSRPGQERLLIFFSPKEIPDIEKYFFGGNKRVEASNVKDVEQVAQYRGSRDLMFEDDLDIKGANTVKYIITNNIQDDAVISKEIVLRHK
jgi:hypothetical protein